MKKNLTLLFVCIASLLAAQIPTNGLITHFTFDSTLVNTTGTDTLESGNANYITRGCGSAQSLTNSSYTFPNAGIGGLPAGSAQRSVAFWYRSENITTHSLFNYGTISGYFGVVYDASNASILVTGGSSDISATYEEGTNWTHIAVTYGGGITNLYINGNVAASSNSITFSTVPSPSVSRLGHSPFSGEYSDYSIDELMVYNRALTQEEITDIYNITQTNIAVSQLPVVARPIMCQGDTINLSVAAIGPNLTYQWQQNGQDIAGATDTFLQTVVNTEGVFNYHVEITSDCGIVLVGPAIASVFSYPTPTIVQTGNLLQTQGYSSYQWLLNGEEIPDATGPDHEATEPGVYTVAVTRQDGTCVGVSPAVTVTSVGIADVDGFSLAIYPNPATEILAIQSRESIEGVEVYNMLGVQVKNINGNVRAINVAELAKGLYTIRILTTNGLAAVKTFARQ